MDKNIWTFDNNLIDYKIFGSKSNTFTSGIKDLYFYNSFGTGTGSSTSWTSSFFENIGDAKNRVIEEMRARLKLGVLKKFPFNPDKVLTTPSTTGEETHRINVGDCPLDDMEVWKDALAHAHVFEEDEFYHQICIKLDETVFNPDGTPHDVLLHEWAHIKVDDYVTPHGQAFAKVLADWKRPDLARHDMFLGPVIETKLEIWNATKRAKALGLGNLTLVPGV